MRAQLASVLLLAGIALAVDTDLHESEKAFEAEFHKLYGDKKSEAAAAAALKKSEKQINEENQRFKEGKAHFYEELNPLSDIPTNVFKKEKEGYIDFHHKGRGYLERNESEWYTHPDLEKLYMTIDRQSIPNSYDATFKDLVTSVKDQMACGSCAAFAVTSVHETCMLLSGARFNGLDLSEQQIIDCGFNPNNGMNGCNGANPGSYMEFYASSLNGRSIHEADYPYLDRNPKLTCPTEKPIYNSGAYVSKALVDHFCDEDKLKTLVATYGAVTVGVYASDRAFSNYANGIFDGCTSTQHEHAITVVGYGTDPNTGLDYWLAKNSWGAGWGLNGYIKIKRGVNMCGIGAKCFTAECAKTSGSLSDPPIIPPPPPMPVNLECDLSSKFGPITGTFNMNFGSMTGMISSQVVCTNGVCRPRLPGPSNACMYICGKLSC